MFWKYIVLKLQNDYLKIEWYNLIVGFVLLVSVEIYANFPLNKNDLEPKIIFTRADEFCPL